MHFWLGTHETHWLARYDTEFFVSDVRLRKRKKFPRARAPWALDSGGFSELSLRGEWSTGPVEYLDRVARYADEIGHLAWAAPQDWMCEPFIIAKTGLSVVEHQTRTVENFLELDAARAGMFIPVLQGWKPDDYYRHAEQYARAGVDLGARPLVGIGSVCRRGGTGDAAKIITTLRADGIKLHGFGLKITALKAIGHLLASADSMAWSYNARRNPPIEGHTHYRCNNCPEWAFRWRERVMEVIEANEERNRVAA